MAVYIPPDANVSTALSLLHDCITRQMKEHPDGAFVVAGDFNRACLKSVLPRYAQYVHCPTRGENTLDKAYSNLKQAYKAVPLPHLDSSDHLSLLLVPAYIPSRKRAKIVTKSVTTWPEGALDQLQDCFQNTDWTIFEHPELQVHTDSILCYIKHCTDTVTVSRRVRVYPNRKPWMTPAVKALLKARNAAFKSGDRALYSAARSELRRGIRTAKEEYRRKVESHLEENDSRRVWQGIQQLTNFRSSRPTTAVSMDASLAEELNHFFARFETASSSSSSSSSASTPLLPEPQPPGLNTLTIQEHQVRRVLLGINPRKAAGPDGVMGKVLQACADQLAGVLTGIFNTSLSLAEVPPCLKASTIIPVPKKTSVRDLNDYRPVALTSVVMKCFKKLFL